ncbi:hypothetical protein F5Y03DRAFT_195574 [Xylaria venustula]|nr:hypothetical protein F5Y03DRAFT_195574 [Xylaria venustula]
MKTALRRRTVVLFGLVALAATCVQAQGFGGGTNPWGYGSPTNNPDGSNGDTSSGSGTSDGDSGSGSSSSSSSDDGSGNGNSVTVGGGDYGGSSGDIPTSGGNGGYPGYGSGSGPGFGLSDTGLDISEILSFPVAHGALAATAFAFVFPLGAILMRVVPGRPALLAHGFAQVLATALYIAGAGLGLYLVSIIRIPQTGEGLLDTAGRNAHPIIGIVLLVALFIQPFLGVVHHRRFKRLQRRTWVSYAHLWTGRLGITLGIINGGLGFALAGTRGAPVVAYAVVSAFMWLLWVLTALFFERGRSDRQVKEKRNREKIAEDEGGRGYMPAVRGGGPGSTRPPTEHGEEDWARHHGVPPTPSFAEVSMDVPSPPYEPGPNYAAHMAHVHREPDGREMPNMKGVLMDRSDEVSILTAVPDEMNRGQV